jgi:ferric-dicitrate binding protein FerR (iron transport regulator)
LADTQVVLLASDSAPSLLLRRGTVLVDEKDADSFQVAVPGGLVLVEGSPQIEAECEIAALENATTVSVKRGLAEIHGLGEPVVLQAGQSAQVAAGPQGGQPPAGKISREIPKGEIEREGIKPLPLQLHQPVNWNDRVVTEDKGRAQITLLDGSTLNVGIRSKLRIVQHDPAKQLTQIQLLEGRVRADVKKVTDPNGKFELDTESAVIGTIDTSFVATTDPKTKTTRVCGVKGTTKVQSLDPKFKNQEVKLHRKQCTVVIFGAPPTSPVFAPAQMASMLNQTAVQAAGGVAGLSAPAVAGIAGGGAAAAAVTGVVLATTGATSPTTPTTP